MGDAVQAAEAVGDVNASMELGLVAGGVISSYRACMLERDLWGHIRARFAQRGPYSAEWLDGVSHQDWVGVEALIALLDVMGEIMGLDELRWMVRKRIVDPAGSNFFAPILRSWARSFGTSPEHMLRGVVHVWRAALRGSGTMRHLRVRPDEVHLVIEGPLSSTYRASPAFCAQLEGLAFSLLDFAQPRPVFVEVEMRPERAPVSLVCKFRN